MRRWLSVIVVFSVLALPVTQAFAYGYGGDSGGLYLTEGLMGYSFNFNNGPSSLQQRIYGSSETGIGYVFSSGFYLGGIFTYTPVSDKFSDSSGNSYTHQETYQDYGLSLGYMGENFYILGNYFAAAEKKDVVTGNFTTQNYDYTGTGFGVNVGYKFPVAGFEMAPVISYKYITYVNCKDPYSGATNTCNPAQIQSEFTPYFTFLFNFR